MLRFFLVLIISLSLSISWSKDINKPKKETDKITVKKIDKEIKKKVQQDKILKQVVDIDIKIQEIQTEQQFMIKMLESINNKVTQKKE